MSTRAPIYDPDRGFRVWLISEIYTGENEVGRYIPNVNDAVWDWDNGLYRVTAIDIETGLSTLERFSFIPQNPNVTPDDILLGAVPGRASECYRLYVNDKTEPITAVADSRLFLYGSDNEYIRYFKGFDISDRGEVISLFYDENNNLKDDKIPLELVVVPEGDNRAIKTPMSGYVTAGLDDGEVATCVVYGSSGIVSSVNPLLIKNTAFIRGKHIDTKYVTHISITSPFLVDESSDRLEVPLHTPINDIGISVKVHYSNGAIETVLVDNKKVILEGLDQFKTSQVNRTVSISVIYKFSENEANYNSNADNGMSITKTYQITTLNPLATGVVKIFVIPKWDDRIEGWDLKYYLYNLDRSLFLDVNEYVRVVEPEDKGFDPKDYGNLQRLKFSIDLDQIEEVTSDYVHTQEFDITLFCPIDESAPSWTFTYSDVGDVVYGVQQRAVFDTFAKINTVSIASGMNQVTPWLELMFNSLYPLLQPVSNEVIIPSHVVLIYEDNEKEVEVDDALNIIEFDVTPRSGDTLYIKWIKRIESRDLELAISPLVIV